MIGIELEKFESFEHAWKRFEKVVERSGLWTEMRRRAAGYVKPSLKKKQKSRAARAKALKAMKKQARYQTVLVNREIRTR